MEEELKQQKGGKKSSLAMFSDVSMRAEKIRVAAQVRLKHLKRLGRTCRDTEEVLKRSWDFEKWSDGNLRERLKEHPAYWWFSQVNGAAPEIVAKIVGETEDFGRYYDVDDPMIPPEVRERAPESYIAINAEDKEVEKIGVWVEAIERLQNPSKYRVFNGHWPGAQRKAGEKHSYNAQLRTLFWRLGTALMWAKGPYYQFYLNYKESITKREEAKGTKIIPTPKERFCSQCEKPVIKKKAKFCPDCGKPLSLKKEPLGCLYVGHIHHMAQRRMQQLFGDHLIVIWRKSLGLPVPEPYPMDILGHSGLIKPEDMMDKSGEPLKGSIPTVTSEPSALRKPKAKSEPCFVRKPK